MLRNRLQHIESHNMRRVGAALDELARRVGFRVIPGLGERVIYRELFPKGLTLLDLQQFGEVGLGHITARQELREMIAGPGHSGRGTQAEPHGCSASAMQAAAGMSRICPRLTLNMTAAFRVFAFAMTHTLQPHHPARI